MIRRLIILLTCTFLASCTEEVRKISAPDNVQLNIYEVRMQGGGLADDMLRVYLEDLGGSILDNDKPIFEAENVGRVCYRWPSIDVLEIRTDGNNAYAVEPLWKRSDGRVVRLYFMGHRGCPWRAGD